VTDRVIWPFMVGYVAAIRSVMAWCETRGDYRIFRTDRMTDVAFLDCRYPEHSVVLRRRWLACFADARHVMGDDEARDE
jgi:predicted DNA-binding transcriptional regulator YafY